MQIRFRFHKGKTVIQHSSEGVACLASGEALPGPVLEMRVPRRFSFRLHEIVPLNKNELWQVIGVGHEGFTPTLDLIEVAG
jgi:hypothetical protein